MSDFETPEELSAFEYGCEVGAAGLEREARHYEAVRKVLDDLMAALRLVHAPRGNSDNSYVSCEECCTESCWVSHSGTTLAENCQTTAYLDRAEQQLQEAPR